MRELYLGAVHAVDYPSADGTRIQGFIMTPPGYVQGQRYPTLLDIHGGPVSQYDYSFYFEDQLYAANGYVVLMPNPRGSSGRGQAFSHAIWQSWGERDYEDVMAAVDHAVAAGYADPDRLGVGGWSYGGLLTNNVITRTTASRRRSAGRAPRCTCRTTGTTSISTGGRASSGCRGRTAISGTASRPSTVPTRSSRRRCSSAASSTGTCRS
jgi:dipeptidyl aminopeptidase/acylaminoacyl peptidase